MKYLVFLSHLIMGSFFFPLTSLAICDQANTKYSFFDIIIGKNTDAIIDCVNNVMKSEINSSTYSSIPKNTSYLSSVNSHNTFIGHSKSDLSYFNYNYYNYEFRKDISELTTNWETTSKLVSCH